MREWSEWSRNYEDMSDSLKVTCDFCGKDLTSGENFEDYSLRLINRRIPCSTLAVIDIMFIPPINKDCDFCGLRCLRKFLEKIK